MEAWELRCGGGRGGGGVTLAVNGGKGGAKRGRTNDLKRDREREGM